MRRSLRVPVVLVASVVLLAACGSGGTPATSPSLAPSEAPTASPTAATAPPASGGLGSTPYTITIPSAWQEFNLADPAAKAGLDAFVEANPTLAAAIQQFESIPGVRMAIDPLLGDVMLVITTQSGGVPLDILAQSFTAQFQTVSGLEGTPTPQDVTLPGGNAVHWDLKLTSNKPGGGTISVEESVYLFANATNAVIVEFVTPSGGAIPDEQSIVASFKFSS